MGWRAWDAYESDAEARRRALPWRARYNWRNALVFAGFAALLGGYFYFSYLR